MGFIINKEFYCEDLKDNCNEKKQKVINKSQKKQ